MSEVEKKRGRGRPGTYANSADRARAWRQRQKDLIAQARVQPEPVVVEKIVEKVIEVPAVSSGSHKSKGGAQLQASRLRAILRDRFSGFGGEDDAKRLRTNTSKVAGTAREILRMLDRKADFPVVEYEFLREVADFFESLSAQFEVAQRGAKQDSARRETEYKAQREAELSEIVRTLFGQPIDPDRVRAIAAAMLACSDVRYRESEAKRLGVDRVYFGINDPRGFQYALSSDNISRVARLVAESRLSLEEKGQYSQYRGKSYYDLGWSDIDNYVRTKINGAP